MVFLVRETLTEEDRAAYQRLRDRRMRETRRKRRRDKLGWLGDQLSRFICTAMGLLALYAIGSGGMSVWYLPCAVIMLVCGVVTFSVRRRSPARETDYLPKEEIPLSDPVRAAFFGDGCFAFWNVSGKVRLGYSSIISVWEDAKRFYLFFADRPPLLLPKRGFAGGTPEDFRSFLERETGWIVERIK